MSHNTTHDNPYTRGIAEFVAGLAFDVIPAEVRTRDRKSTRLNSSHT